MTDTILAVSSPPSPGGTGVRAIVRLSGPAAHTLAKSVACFPAPPAAARGWFPATLNDPPLPASILFFTAPHSFTGQDIAELHLPHSPALLRHLQDQLLAAARFHQLPARLADPGEFSARAFFNGKIDLTEAEGIAATISASSAAQLRAAANLREGDLHRRIDALSEHLADLLARVEAGIDFADEEGISFIDPPAAAATVARFLGELDSLLHHALRLDRLDVAPTVVFVGKPNVGKSSLINALTGTDRSIVSDIAGTTRDLLSATLATPGGAIRLVDVPGEEAASDIVRSRMMEARRLALLEADLVVHVIDHQPDPGESAPAACSDPSQTPAESPAEVLPIQNKCDLLPAQPAADRRHHRLQVSARTGQNLQALRTAIARRVLRREPLAGTSVVLNQRHRTLLAETRSAVSHAAIQIGDARSFQRHPELLAVELRRALDLLGQITGAISPDEVLGRIFSRFCIGK